MRHIIVLFALLALLMLGGCRLDPDGLLGNDPSEQEVPSLQSSDAYSLCREQNVVVGDIVNYNGCATPANLAEFLVRFKNGNTQEGYSNTRVVRIEFKKMWDGTYPKIAQLRYGHWESGSNVSGQMTSAANCQILTSETANRVYECRLEAESSASSYFQYRFSSLTLTHDNGASKATYTAKYLFDECEDSDFNRYPSAPDVYFNRQEVPEISITPKDQP